MSENINDQFPEINDETLQILDGMQGGPVEIIPGMTVEEMKTVFCDTNSMISQPYRLWQMNSAGHRYYYKFDEMGNPEFYPSVTTVISQTLTTSKYLIEWIAGKGLEEAERYKNERAMYGTFMHAEIQELLLKRSYDFDILKDRLKTYMEVNRLPDGFIYYADEFKKDILAFVQFMIDYDVRPLAIEIALVHPYHKYAGMIDLPCSILTKPGAKTRMNVIIDFKSGRKGFYEAHEIQLHLYKMMWNVNFPKHEIDKVFNWSPKEWRKYPSYNFTDKTDSPNAAKIPALLMIAEVEDNKKENVFTSISGVVNLDESRVLSKNIIALSLSDIVKSKAPADAVKKEVSPEKETADIEPEKPEKLEKTEKSSSGSVTIVKRKRDDIKKVTPKETKTTKRAISSKKKETPAKAAKKPRSKKAVVSKKDLLKGDQDF